MHNQMFQPLIIYIFSAAEDEKCSVVSVSFCEFPCPCLVKISFKNQLLAYDMWLGSKDERQQS